MARKKNTEAKSLDSVVELARKRFERCRAAYSANRTLAIEDTKFALGDSDNGWQWPEDIRTNRTGDKRPCLTVNMTAQHCNQIINNIRQNRPQARVLPVDNKSDKKSAEIMAGLVRNIQVSSNADDAHDLAAEHSVYGGEGYWRILTEYESESSFNQLIKIKSIANPLLVYIDCDAVELDKSDAKYAFIFDDLSKEQCKTDYPDTEVSTWALDSDGWVQQDTVRIAEYFYQEQVADTAFLMPNGETVLKSQEPDAEPYAIKSRPTKRTQWKWCKLIGGHEEPKDPKDWAGSYMPVVACVGKEVNVNGEIVRKGLVRDLKDPARMVNYSYSAAIETVALQNKVPYMAAAEAIEGYEDIWGRANLENRAYLPFNAFDENGNAIPTPQRQQPAVMPAAQVQMLQLSTEQMRAASGQQNANFGIKSEAQSGVGIQRLKAQGEIATFHFPDNLVRALRYEAKVLLDLIPKIYDTRRVVRILGLDGTDEQAVLDPDLQQPSIEDKTAAEIKQAFNPSLGLYDVVIDTGPSFQTQRQEAATALTELASKNPALMQVAGDLIMRSYDFPMADQLANRLEKTLPPGIKDDEEGPQIPPQVQQAMEQMGMQMQQMQQALQEAQAAANDKSVEGQAKMGDLQLKARELELKEQEMGIKAYDAETKRLQLMKPDAQAQEPQQAQQPQAEQPDLAEALDRSALSNQTVAAALAQLQSQQQTSEALMAIAAKLAEPKPPISMVLQRQPDGSLIGQAV